MKRDLAQEIAVDVDNAEQKELIKEFDYFMHHRKTRTVIRPYIVLAEYCLMKDNHITEQNAKITYPRIKKVKQ
jgi:hypothetical protein